MTEQIYVTPCGDIHYWINKEAINSDLQLVFLPGLTADHRLFEKQIEYFEGKYSVFVWDAPGHTASWPFRFDFNLMDKARWVDEILVTEGFDHPVIIGQSMGGYVGQAYAQLFPEKLKGFVSVDSAPLQRKYVTGLEIWLLKRMEPVYRHYPWKSLLKTGTNGVATSNYGRKLMYNMMMTYNGDQERYSKIAGHGYRILAEAMEVNLPYEIKCPALLICGEKDHAGSCIRYNKAWHKNTGIPIEWIKDAGHNSNTDAPEIVNRLIEELVLEVILRSKLRDQITHKLRSQGHGYGQMVK
ncbi:MAG: alpha/beta hydrolase [Lachnospiraceae bacterium]|nr:alpha/beta hydrolase [Lachnospiraceae bacterium]